MDKVNRKATDYVDPLPHGPIEKVFPDVFFVKGRTKFGVLMWVSRSMTIIREGNDLTVFNSIRLSEEGEKELLRLGRIAHVIRVGGFHGLDDSYYVTKFSADYWIPKGMSMAEGLPEHLVHVLEDDSAALPVKNTAIFNFKNVKIPEACYLVKSVKGGLLITCDSIQYYDSVFWANSWIMIPISYWLGFKGYTIGPMWMKSQKGAENIVLDFQEILKLEFQHVAPGHSTIMKNDAKSMLVKEVERVFKN